MLTAGCTVERANGEFGSGACSDHADNDDDGRADCRDPDCQAEAVCGRAVRALSSDDESEPGQSSRSDASTLPPPSIPDATVPVLPPDDAADAQILPPPVTADPDAPPDAGAEPAKECAEPCGTDETCIMGYCIPNSMVFAEVWKVVSVTIAMPRADDKLMCLDTNTSCLIPSPPSQVFPNCRCAPDPLVRVFVRRPDEEPMLAFDTGDVTQEDGHQWELKDQQLLLRPEYEIVLQALDKDGPSAELVFECSVPADSELLGSGTVSCGKTFNGTGIGFAETFDATIALGVEPGSSPTTP